MAKISNVDDWIKQGYTLSHENKTAVYLTRKITKGYDRFAYVFPRLLGVIFSLGLALVNEKLRIELRNGCLGKKTLVFKKGAESASNEQRVGDAASVLSSSKKSLSPEKIVHTTLESLKKTMREKGVGSIYEARMSFEMNGKKWEWTPQKNSEDQSALVKTDTFAPPIADMLTRVAQENSQEELSMECVVDLRDEKGRHSFRAYYKAGPGYKISNGALFGSWGYTFIAQLTPEQEESLKAAFAGLR